MNIQAINSNSFANIQTNHKNKANISFGISVGGSWDEFARTMKPRVEPQLHNALLKKIEELRNIEAPVSSTLKKPEFGICADEQGSISPTGVNIAFEGPKGSTKKYIGATGFFSEIFTSWNKVVRNMLKYLETPQDIIKSIV